MDCWANLLGSCGTVKALPRVAPRELSSVRRLLRSVYIRIDCRSMSEIGFWSIASARPDHVALIDPDGAALTAGALLSAANQIAGVLRSTASKGETTVAVMLPNGVEFVELYLAIMQIGAYLVPINFHSTAADVGHILADSSADVFIAHHAFAVTASDAADIAGLAADRRFAVGPLPGFRPFGDLQMGAPIDPSSRRMGSIMAYTSGTTGRPKGVRRQLPSGPPERHPSLLAGALKLFGIGPGEDQVHLCTSPLYHSAPLIFAAGCLHLGHRVVLMDKWSAEVMLDLVQRHGVTTTHVVPTQLHRLLSLPVERRTAAKIGSLRHVVHAGAPCPVDVKRRIIDWFGPVVDEYYAATEGGGTYVSSDEWLGKPGTVGKPWPRSEVRIVDDDGNELPAEGTGTVYMRMDSGDFQFHNDPDKTAASHQNGYFTAGDVGYLDEDGYLFLCDRRSDLIISGGVNIYPAEIEAVLLSHPDVFDAGVFGIPNEEWGQEVKAVVQLQPGISSSPDKCASLVEFCGANLARYKVPRSVELTAQLPRDPNGKLARRRLREAYWPLVT